METNRSVLQAACVRAMTELYGDTSKFDGLPEPAFSVKFERKMRRLMAHVRGNRYHRLTRAAKIILVAAILAALAAATVIAARQFGFSLIDRDVFSVLNIEEHTQRYVEPIICGYIPEGFTLKEESDIIGCNEMVYVNEDTFFCITKYASYSNIWIDTEFCEPREITHNGTTYTIAGEDNCPIILWMDPKTQCLYNLSGDGIEEGELLKVAYQTH